MNTRLFALMATVGLLLFALGPGAATAVAETGNEAGNDGTTAGNDALAVAVTEAGNDGATVTVTHDGDPVEGADVSVDGAEDAAYVGEGDYTTTVDGTVAIPEPYYDVTVHVTATYDGETATTTTTLTTEEAESFGMSVMGFVQDMLDRSTMESGIGFQVASFVTQNNPGNAPAHAGPPADTDAQDDEPGPPEDRGNDEAQAQGPPDDDRRGPPEDRGPNGDEDTDDADDVESEETDDGDDDGDADEEADDGDDEGDAEEADEEDDDADDDGDDADEDDEEDDEEDGDRGPPDHANNDR
jgi:hypothetical protein